ncbi:hypothetical protein Tco_0065738 [Tanacetum coccineum]
MGRRSSRAGSSLFLEEQIPCELFHLHQQWKEGFPFLTFLWKLTLRRFLLSEELRLLACTILVQVTPTELTNSITVVTSGGNSNGYKPQSSRLLHRVSRTAECDGQEHLESKRRSLEEVVLRKMSTDI